MSWGDKCFLCDELGHTGFLFRTNRILSVQPKHTTRCHRFHYRKNILPFIPVLHLIQLHLMNLVLYQHHNFFAALICDSRTKPMWQQIQKTLLGNWCQRGRERSHQNFVYRERSHQYFIISLGGENTQGESNLQGSQMLGVQEERCHMSSWGERHVHMCLFALALFICVFELWFSVPYLLPISHARFRGSKTSKGKNL